MEPEGRNRTQSSLKRQSQKIYHQFNDIATRKDSLLSKKQLKPQLENSYWVTSPTISKVDYENAYLYCVANIKKELNQVHCSSIDNSFAPITTTLDQIFPTNPDIEDGYDDMVDMEHFNEAELLFNLKKRFFNRQINTYVGQTLIVLNPFEVIQEQINVETLELYQEQVFKNNYKKQDLNPHIFSLSIECIKQIIQTKKNQAIVISGESGAGKTENTKQAMRFLATLGQYEKQRRKQQALKHVDTSNLIVIEEEENTKQLSLVRRRSSIQQNVQELFKSKRQSIILPDQTSFKFENIEDKIMGCNPILESFGNAKTLRNNNSSRFGKLVLLLVDICQGIVNIKGAVITTYLLEKSRIIFQNKNERNFHIFYHLLYGAPKEFLEKLGLNPDKTYQCMSQKITIPGGSLDDLEMYKEICQSFKTMKFTQEEQMGIWETLAAIILILDVQFNDKTFDSQNPCSIDDEKNLVQICKLLGCDIEKLRSSFLFKLRVFQGQNIMTALNKQDCEQLRDSMAKNLYDKLFNWSIKRMNWAISSPEYLNVSMEEIIKDEKRVSIGLLDIFGFEVFEKNGFEQLCINYANEKLQQLYIQYCFKNEMNILVSEGLKDFLFELKFTDNQSILELFEQRPTGIFSLLDEASAIASNDQFLVMNITKHHQKNQHIKLNKISKDVFMVIHTACDVNYNVIGFRDKNKDELSNQIQDLIQKSNKSQIKKIFNNTLSADEEVEVVISKNIKNEKYLSGQFRAQIRDLVDELKSSYVHFARCVKTNEEKKPQNFHSKMVLQQIRYLGVLESIKVRKDSYPIRKEYQNFYVEYIELDQKQRLSQIAMRQLIQQGDTKQYDFKQLTQQMMLKHLPELGTDQILYGISKIFIRMIGMNSINQCLQKLMQRKIDAAKSIQRRWRIYQAKKKRIVIFKSIRRIQQLFKCFKEYQRFKLIQKSVRQIQKWIRAKKFAIYMKKQLQYIHEQTYASKVIQKTYRMIRQRKLFLKKKKKATMIQKNARIFIIKQILKRKKLCKEESLKIYDKAWRLIMKRFEDGSAIVIQKWVRGYLIRKKYQKQRIEWHLKGIQAKAIKSALHIQRVYRGYLVRQHIKFLNQNASQIQGWMKSIWLSRTFQLIRVSVRKIQRLARMWLINRHIRQERWAQYQESDINQLNEQNEKQIQLMRCQQNIIQQQDNTKQHQHQIAAQNSPLKTFDSALRTLSPIKQTQDGEEENQTRVDFNFSNNNQYSTEPLEYNHFDSPNENMYSPENGQQKINDDFYKTNQEVIGADKIKLFLRVLDVDQIGDPFDIYQPFWFKQFQDAQLENYKQIRDDEIGLQVIEVGETFTVSASSDENFYSWGMNNYFQLGKQSSNQYQIDKLSHINAKKLVAGDNHSFIIDSNCNLIAWGDNSFGQLGGSTNQITNDIIMHKEKVQDIASKGKLNVVLLKNGVVRQWPFYSQTGKVILDPVDLPIPQNNKIQRVHCGHNFSILLSENGLLYSFGQNDQGQLGLDHQNNIYFPEICKTLKQTGEKVTQVSCGFKHSICKTGLGKVFLWGGNDYGQLGFGQFKNQLKPRQINLKSITHNSCRITQVRAGFRCSLLLTENGRIYHWGTNQSIQKQIQPTLLNYNNFLNVEDKDQYQKYIPVRILTSWNKTLSLIYITLADLSQVTFKKMEFTKKICSNLSFNWDNDEVEPPFIESITRYFQIRPYAKIILDKNKEKSIKLDQKFIERCTTPKRDLDPNRKKQLTVHQKAMLVQKFKPFLNEKKIEAIENRSRRLSSPMKMVTMTQLKEDLQQQQLILIKDLAKNPLNKEIPKKQQQEMIQLLKNQEISNLIKKI